MHYNLLFNGCSWTKGSCLDELGLDEETNRFSGVIAQKTDKTVCNIGKSGTGNDSICRRTIEWFEEGNTCDHAIIQWTFKSRFEWIDEDNGIKNFIVNNEVALKNLNPTAKEALQAYYEHVYTDSLGFANLYKNMSFLETYFAMKNQSYSFLRIANRKDLTHKDYFWKSLVKDLYPQNLLTLLGGWYNKEVLFNSHPNAKGHEMIADYIISNFDYFKNAL